MVQESLIEYIQKLVKLGYDAGTIRTTLLNAGYSPSDVDTALRIAGAPVGHRIETRTLAIIFVALLVLGVGVLLMFKALEQPPVQLSFSVDLFSTQVAPGRDLVINTLIVNPSGSKTSGLIDYEVTGPAGKVAAKTESFSVTTQANIPTSISIPSTASTGTYSVRARMSYSNKSPVNFARSFEVVSKVETAVPGEVLIEKKEEKAKELQLTCPGGCDDLNFCTADSCVQGQCVYKSIVPCCGNKECEPSESPSSCVLDCSERPVSVDEIRKKAVEAAVADVGRAAEICDTLTQREYIDSCLMDVSDASNSKESCTAIIDLEKRDACLISFAYQGDYSVCKDITNKYMKNSCVSLSAISQVNATV
jgi:hypothetical protein